MKEQWSWKCIRCECAVACVFCECCPEHCTSLRPNALEAHRRQGKVVVMGEAESPPMRDSEGGPRMSVPLKASVFTS
jgi:hypothetical protein